MEEPVVTLSMIITRGVAEIEHTHGCDERDRTNLRVHVVRIGPCGACSSMIQELCEKRDVLCGQLVACTDFRIDNPELRSSKRSSVVGTTRTRGSTSSPERRSWYALACVTYDGMSVGTSPVEIGV